MASAYANTLWSQVSTWYCMTVNSYLGVVEEEGVEQLFPAYYCLDTDCPISGGFADVTLISRINVQGRLFFFHTFFHVGRSYLK